MQAIRSVDAMGDSMVNLGEGPADERVLSDSFSEDWPDLMIYDLGGAPGGIHRGSEASSSITAKQSRAYFSAHSHRTVS